MPSQRRAKTNDEHRNDVTIAPDHGTEDDASDRVSERRRMWRLEVPAPKLPTIPTVTAVASGGGLTTAIATGHVQPGVVWPAVTLAIAGMAYDVAIHALSRPRRT